ncbi:hypothetical protein AX15_005228 [Amanita polypyramis BW_CC]|nr:hypothetical protein AX15_005228 [Amanita polypyramis BW_CC]
MDIRPDKVDTPPAEWPVDRLTAKLLTCLSTRQLREINKYGPPALWESLHEGGFGDNYELINKLCNLAFPLYQPLTAEQAEQSAIDLGINVIEVARTTPPLPTHMEEPDTPKGPAQPRKTHFSEPEPEAMNTDTIDSNQIESNTQHRASQLLKRGLTLISQLHKLWTAASEIQGNSSHELLEAIRISFHLQGGDPDTPTWLTTRATDLNPGPSTSYSGPIGPSTTTLHAPQPTRPITLQMPPSRTPKPTRPPRE